MVSGGGEICNLAMSSPGFPSGSAGKESACNEGDLGSIPGLRRSPGEGKGHPRQYSWASLVAQLVKNPSAIQKTWVQSLGWKDPLEKATHSSILAWRIPWTIYPVGSQRVATTEQLSLHMSSPLCSLSLGPRWTDTHLLEVLTSTRQHPQPLGAGSSLSLQKK